VLRCRPGLGGRCSCIRSSTAVEPCDQPASRAPSRHQFAGLAWLVCPHRLPTPLLRSLEPSEELAALAVDALWSSGLAWAQARALHLFEQAARWAGAAALELTMLH
jgi:hypothetical protein